MNNQSLNKLEFDHLVVKTSDNTPKVIINHKYYNIKTINIDSKQLFCIVTNTKILDNCKLISPLGAKSKYANIFNPEGQKEISEWFKR